MERTVGFVAFLSARDASSVPRHPRHAHGARAWPATHPRGDRLGNRRALAVSRLMQQALFEVNPPEPLVYLALSVTLLLVAGRVVPGPPSDEDRSPDCVADRVNGAQCRPRRSMEPLVEIGRRRIRIPTSTGRMGQRPGAEYQLQPAAHRGHGSGRPLHRHELVDVGPGLDAATNRDG